MPGQEIIAGCVFPGIVEISDVEKLLYSSYRRWIQPHLKGIAEQLPHDIANAVADGQPGVHLGASGQLVSYAYSCALYDELITQKGTPRVFGGYSMGIFAALYASGSISFLRGLCLLYELNSLIDSLCAGQSYGMAVTVGLEKEKMAKELEKVGGVDIVNDNAPGTLVLSGYMQGIEEIEARSDQLGVYYFKRLSADRPYHSHLLQKGLENWTTVIHGHRFADPKIPIISATSGEILTTRWECRDEARLNFCSPFSWLTVLQTLKRWHIHDLYDCGIGGGMAKLGKYSGVAHQYHLPKRFIREESHA